MAATDTRSLLLLGATGSIGQSTLDVVRAHPDRYTVKGMVGGARWEPLAAAALEFHPPYVALADASGVKELSQALAGQPCTVLGGGEGVMECVQACGADLCVSAVVGSAGLAPTLAAVSAGMDVALANKEALVAAGHLLTAAVDAHGVHLVPVDSEHSALLQCLAGADRGAVKQIVLTASGGPFRGREAAALESVTREEALAHPTWNMGEKITVDSASLANKGLEVIEAHWLFAMPYDRINVVVHPQSVVHGMVAFADGVVLAQMACPDMRIPIQYALAYPEHLNHAWPRLDLCAAAELTFEPADRAAFPMLELAYEAGRLGKSAPAVYSAANEEAVARFLSGAIGFMDIPRSVAAALEALPPEEVPTLEAIEAVEARARETVRRRCEAC